MSHSVRNSCASARAWWQLPKCPGRGCSASASADAAQSFERCVAGSKGIGRVKPNVSRLTMLMLISMSLSACQSMLPSAKQDAVAPWQSFGDVKASYDKIVPYSTSMEAVRLLGFDPSRSTNMQVLNQAQVVSAVLPSPLQDRSSVPKGILDCMQVQDACVGYLAEPNKVSHERIGNFLLDFLNFKRTTLTSGWRFSALIVVIDDMVVYKQWNGQPYIESIDRRINPLGPLQSMGESLKVNP